MDQVIGKYWAKPAAKVAARPKVGAIPEDCKTISTGVCKILKAKKGVKPGRGVVRVVGPNTAEGHHDIDAAAEIVAKKLDAGAYNGPEIIEASRILAGDFGVQVRKRWSIDSM